MITAYVTSLSLKVYNSSLEARYSIILDSSMSGFAVLRNAVPVLLNLRK
jgi:hypothetical protein